MKVQHLELPLAAILSLYRKCIILIKTKAFRRCNCRTYFLNYSKLGGDDKIGSQTVESFLEQLGLHH